MRSFSTEVYTPCDLCEIGYTSNKKCFSNSELDKVVSFKRMVAVPFFRGALILIGEGSYFTYNFEKLTEIDRLNKTLGEHLKKYPELKIELEELNAIGAINFIKSTDNIFYSKELLSYKSQYPGEEWINFSLAPIVLELDITNKCNAKCIHCSRSAEITSAHLEFEKIDDILKCCKKYYIPTLLLMGGEPLLHPDIVEILSNAKKYGIPSIRTSTNGLIITDKMADMLACFLSHIQVSIHGAKASTHEQVTGIKGSFEIVCDAVRRLRSRNITVDISFSVLDSNQNEISSMPQLALDLGANGLRYLALSNVGRATSLPSFGNDRRESIGEIIKNLYLSFKDRGLKIEVGGFPALEKIRDDAQVYGCVAGRTLSHISYQGIVNPCGSVDGYPVSNLDTTDFLSSWHNEKLKAIRKASDCKCVYRYICSGSCKSDTDFSSKIQ